MRILIVFVFSILAYTPAALACGGAPCGDACNMGDAPSDSADLSSLEGERAAFSVEGMKCGRCSAKVVAALNAIEGVKGASVDHATGNAQVVFQAGKTDSAALLAAITATGYARGFPPWILHIKTYAFCINV